jgi:5-deoxy-glucuronate isomerase
MKLKLFSSKIKFRTMELLKKYKQGYGRQNVVSFGEGGLKKSVFDLLKLEAGKSYTGNTDNFESVFVILSGTCNISGDGFKFENIGNRKDVFSGKPTAVYLPYQTGYEVRAITGVEIAVCSAESTLKLSLVLIRPEDVKEVELGIMNWHRKAYLIIDQGVDSQNLFLGETHLPPGKWAFPPHRHDKDNLPEEADMEEIYHFRINPPSGFGIQLSYTDDRSRDDAHLIRNGDTVILPDGYHPACASPADSLYILWFMAGDKRMFLSRPDDDYKWVTRYELFLKQVNRQQ